MSPWSARTFRKHNKNATKAQLKAGATKANDVLKATGDEGMAVAAGNAEILRMHRKRTGKRRT